jgi:hypothetical protein
MKHRLVLLVTGVIVSLAFLGARGMEEGMWLPDAARRLPLADFRKSGLELSAEQIFSTSGPSLKDAIVLLGGGTGSFISPEGLIVTNHHVAFAGLQSLSSVQDDYLRNGFWAQTRDQELSTTYTAQVVVDMKDVTREVQAALTSDMTPEARAKALAARTQEIESAAKGASDRVCRVSEMNSGVQYVLFTYEQLRDVRMVYAPPGAIGNYGGETDNWMWPRHTGDFSLMRAYVGKDGKPAKYAKDNVPYRPRAFLPVSTKGYGEGTFAMIMGFPGRTFRYREAAGIALAREEVLPMTAEVFHLRMEVMEQAWKNDRALQIKLASRWRGLANTYKNTLGTLEGMRKADLVTLRQNEEKAFATWIRAASDRTAAYGTLLADLGNANAELRSFSRKNVLLLNLGTGVDLYRLANRYRAFAATRDSLGEDVPVPEKILGSITEFAASVHRIYDPAVDKATLVALILKGLDLPGDQQIAAFQEIAGDRTGEDREEAVREFVDDLYAHTKLATPEGAQDLLDRDPDRIRQDAFVEFAATVAQEAGAVTARYGQVTALLTKLRGKYIEGWTAWKGKGLVYPDANRTLRLTMGTVKSYAPRDAVVYRYETTLAGVMEKETGEGDFVVPPKLRELWQKKDFGPYADRKSGDIPVAFLANLDITGGNSGSPVINGKGELIGCAFDGNWEAVVGDFLFQEPLNRTISVDSRYMLFVLDKFSGAQTLLKEMTIR